jgi:hypothetical protein
MTSLMQTIHAVLQWIDPILGVLAFFPIYLTFHEIVYGRRRRHKRWFNAIRREPGSRPSVLIIDILPGKAIGLCAKVGDGALIRRRIV